MKFGNGIHGPQGMNHSDFDLLNLPLAPPACLHLKCRDNNRMDCQEILH